MRMLRLLGALLGTVTLALVSQSCSYLLGDPYGDYMQKADRWVNLRSELQTKGLTLNDAYGLAVVQASFGGTPYNYVFFVANFADGTSRIRALGYDGLDLLGFEASPSGGIFSAASDINGYIKIGDRRPELQREHASPPIERPTLGQMAHHGYRATDKLSPLFGWDEPTPHG
jgi:hypothetical protein